jgi:hypothetical protein
MLKGKIPLLFEIITARSGDNTLPTADQKETGSKPSKSRSDSKWNHNNWDRGASSGG